MANELYAGQPGSNVQVAGAPYVRAMYVWGPGDSPTSGVDELLLQIDPRDTGTGAVSAFGGKPWFAVSDAQGDLVALLHKQTASSTVQIAAQWTYSPYGEVLTYEQFHPHPVVVFGHKSLVVDRLDTQAVSWDTALGTISDTQRLIPGAKLIAYARNRTYSPGLGRWLQQDPNASGQGVLESIRFFGANPGHTLINVAYVKRLGDGLNLAAYLSSNPVMSSDPTGLFSTAGLAPLAPGAALSFLWNGLSGVILGGAAGGVLGGGISAAMGGDFWDGAISGAIAGATTGGLGGAFGASASGLFGTLLTNGAGGFTSGLYQSGGSISAALSNAWWSGITGGVLGGLSKGFMAAAGSSAASRGLAWAMGPLERGKLLDKMYKRLLGGALPDNYPVIDCFQNGTATSIKSMDFAAASNQSAGSVTSTLRGYVDQLAGFTQYTRGANQIQPGQIQNRMLFLIVPDLGSSAQQAAINNATAYAASRSVLLRVQVHP
jgi:hypothetical protein